MLTELLKSVFEYNPETGVFFRNGKPSGSVLPNGYVYLSLKKKRMLAHRIAWLMMTGMLPDAEVDHINRIRSDNRWSNLRIATRSQNAMNQSKRSDSRSGHKGVSWHSRVGKWRASIRAGGKHVHLGYYDSSERAAMAYNAAARSEFKQFHYEHSK